MAGPEKAVSGTVNGISNPAFFYDSSVAGAMTEGAGKTYKWMSFNRPSYVNAGNTRLDWLYGENLNRVRETLTVNGANKRTIAYVSLPDGSPFYEDETGNAGLRQRSFISLGGDPIAAVNFDGTRSTVQYFHRDALGSLTAVTDVSGALVERLAYEPFGKRRNVDGTTDMPGLLAASSARRGFTGHEMLDEVGLINMNGRLFDPALSRFVSPDPLSGDPEDGQDHNSFSYVANSPTTFVDPSGFQSQAASRIRDFAAQHQQGFGFVGVEQFGGQSYLVAGRVSWSSAGGGSSYGYGKVVGFAVPVDSFGVGAMGAAGVAAASGMDSGALISRKTWENIKEASLWNDVVRFGTTSVNMVKDVGSLFGSGHSTALSSIEENGPAYAGTLLFVATHKLPAAGGMSSAGGVGEIASAANYRSLFKQARPDLPNGWQVHHSIPQKYEELMGVSSVNIHDVQFLRGVSPQVHSKITAEWARFDKAAGGNPSAAQIAEFAKKLDRQYYGGFMWPGY